MRSKEERALELGTSRRLFRLWADARNEVGKFGWGKSHTLRLSSLNFIMYRYSKGKLLD